jgi:hypothetical protein
MSRFTTNTNYPLIPNSNEYMIEQRVVSIHSEDRDVTKWPSSSNFEIELPDDYVNVSTVKLGNYTFPANYNTFSLGQANIGMTFAIDKPFNPSEHGFFDPLLNAMFEALYSHIDDNFIVTISEGFYNPIQIATELTNRFNETVNTFIAEYLSVNYPDLLPQYTQQGGYSQFVVVYNQVTQTLWFGNKSSGFTLTNGSKFYLLRKELLNLQCFQNEIEDFSNWGLPAFLGFTRCPTPTITNTIPGFYPRFYYGDALTSGDNGYWLVPDQQYNTQTVFYLEAPAKINLMGNAYFYIEIAGLNNIDETSPFSLTNFTRTTNENNGVHNSAFAKIGVTTTPISQWYDSNTEAVKIFNPPAERIRRLKIKIRYHNGLLVEFGKFNYSFNLIFQLLRPQNLRSYITFDPTSNALSGSSTAVAKKS